MKIKSGDQVRVMAGKSRGHEGKVLAVDPAGRKVKVEGANIIKRNTKVNQGARGAKEGGIITQEAFFDASNVMLLDPEDHKPTRVGYRFGEDGKKIRISRRSGKDI